MVEAWSFITSSYSTGKQEQIYRFLLKEICRAGYSWGEYQTVLDGEEESRPTLKSYWLGDLPIYQSELTKLQTQKIKISE